MKFIKKLLAGAAIAAAGFSSAQAVTVAGVTWDPSSPLDFSAASVSIHQFINSSGILSGFGTINTINGTAGFCAGCELTFQFGGFTPIGGILPSPSGGTILYKDGFVNVFVDTSPEAANLNAFTMSAASTGDGALWLSLAGHNKIANGSSFDGTLNLSSGGALASLLGGGLLDVTGGLAASLLNTNQKNEGSDFSFSTSFTTFLTPGSPLDAIGTGNFNSVTLRQVPEPSSIALLGLGLAGIGLASRRRKGAGR
ncbi:MAG: sorting protein [Rhodoferax sp.]|nr:sorting protein [Rhodoferax sp.]